MLSLARPGVPRGQAPRLVAAALALFVFSAPVLATERLLTLGEAVDLAVSRSPAVQAARAGVVAARNRLAEAEAGFKPRATLSGAYTRLGESASVMPPELLAAMGIPPGAIPESPLNNYDVRLTLSYPLYTGGGLEAGEDSARAGLEAAETRLEQAVQEAAFAATQAYYGLRSARELKEIARLSLVSAEGHAAQVEAAYEAGTVLRTDLLRVRVQVGNARQALIKADHGVKLAQETLLSLTGLEPGTVLQLPEQSSPAPMTDDLDRLVSAALANRRELAALRKAADIARAGLKAAQAQFRPSVASALTVDWQGAELGELDHNWTLMVTATWNAFDGGVARARVGQAEAALAEALENVRRLEEGVRLEVRQAYQAVREAEEALPVAVATQEQAEENLELARVRFDAGLATPADVTDAQLLLAQARMNRVQAVNDHFMALARLAKVTGAPIPR